MGTTFEEESRYSSDEESTDPGCNRGEDHSPVRSVLRGFGSPRYLGVHGDAPSHRPPLKLPDALDKDLGVGVCRPGRLFRRRGRKTNSDFSVVHRLPVKPVVEVVLAILPPRPLGRLLGEAATRRRRVLEPREDLIKVPCGSDLLLRANRERGLGCVDGVLRKDLEQSYGEEKGRATRRHRAPLPEDVTRLREGEVVALFPLPAAPGVALPIFTSLS